MTRDELIETMARAMDAAAGTHSAPPFSATWGEHAAAALAAIGAAGLAIVPVEATNAMICAGVSERHIRRVPFAWNKATVSVYHAMIEAGRL